jgi:hypothetical protein
MAEEDALGADAEPAASRPLERRQRSMLGLRIVAFEHTAWDLALATQSLAHIDAALGGAPR